MQETENSFHTPQKSQQIKQLKKSMFFKVKTNRLREVDPEF